MVLTERGVMMRNFFLIMFFCAVSAVGAFGSPVSDVVLDDGSVIHAEVVSLQDGKYTMRSQSMGTFQLDASRVQRISRPGQDQQVPAAGPNQLSTTMLPESLKSQVQDAQAQIMNDPEAMAMVSTLATDPEFTELTSDPEAMADLQAGDIEKLKNNPRFNKIMQNPKMQAIAAKINNNSSK